MEPELNSILGRLRKKAEPPTDSEAPDSMMFTTAFQELGVDASLLVPWDARALEVGARPLSPAHGTELLQGLWAKDKYMSLLDAVAIARMERFLDFCSVPPNQDIIRQDEYGNFMVVILTGAVAVDRLQPWGERLRLAETRPGEILGEMSLLDSGIRFSACSTLSDCDIAVLGADAMDDMLNSDPTLAANLIALLARKLSLRLRVVSARLSDKK